MPDPPGYGVSGQGAAGMGLTEGTQPALLLTSPLGVYPFFPHKQQSPHEPGAGWRRKEGIP